MAGRKSGLGRGLDALLPSDRPDLGFLTIPVDRVIPNPSQPRRHFDEDSLEALAASIRCGACSHSCSCCGMSMMMSAPASR